MAFPRKVSSLQESENKCSTLTEKLEKDPSNPSSTIRTLQQARHS